MDEEAAQELQNNSENEGKKLMRLNTWNHDYPSIEDICEKLTKCFPPDASRKREIDWTCLEIIFPISSESLLCSEEYVTCIELIFGLFEDFHCIDTAVIRRWLLDYAIRKLRCCGVLEFLKSDPKLFSSWEKCKCGGSDTRITFLDRFRLKFDSSLLSPYYFRDYMLVQRLLRYGVPFDPGHLNIYGYVNFVLHRLWESDLRPLSNLWIFCDMADVFEENARSAGSRRMPLIWMFIDAVAQKRLSEHSSYKYYWRHIQSLKLIFKTIPDPLITVEEVCKSLDMLLLREGFSSEFCEEFQREFPKSAQQKQPRRLKHLCRCVVRERLRDAGKLSHGVWELNIPKLLRNYLLLQKHENEFRPKYKCVYSPRQKRFVFDE